MEGLLQRLSLKRILIILLVVILALVIAFGLHTKSHLDSFVNNLKFGGSSAELATSASALSGDANLALSLAELPVIKQMLSVAGVNFVPIKDEIRAVIEAAPLLAGADRPKRYLIAFQNSAEARGTGGILGAYALIEFNKGSLKVIQTGSNEALYKISRSKIPVDVPAEFLKLYGDNPAILQNSNLSPHFPYGAQIWLALWKAKFGEQLDGVIAIDPTALSYVLRATGPITLESGEKVTSKNLVSDTLKDAYKRFESDNHARKQYLVTIINATLSHLTQGKFSKIKMAEAIRDGIIDNRMLIYSRDSAVESKLSNTRLGGFLKTEPNNEYRAVIENIDASKLDYYLQKSVVIESKSCKNPHETQVRVRLTNTLKSPIGLPAYVLTRSDKTKPANLVSGQHRFKLFIYGPTNSQLVSISRENKTNGLGGASKERGRPIYVADVDLKPGQSENLLANFEGGVGKISFVDQPLVIPTELSIKGGC